LHLKCDFRDLLVSKFAFKFNLYWYIEATIGLTAADPNVAKEEKGRTMQLCGMQILGALAMSGTLDLGGLIPLVRHKGPADSPGHPVEGDAVYICTVGLYKLNLI
jgi:hypothetical protein